MGREYDWKGLASLGSFRDIKIVLENREEYLQPKPLSASSSSDISGKVSRSKPSELDLVDLLLGEVDKEVTKLNITNN